MATSLKRLESRLDDEEGMTLEERAEAAEIRFKVIADRVAIERGWNKYVSETDFVESNISQSKIAIDKTTKLKK